MKPINTGKYGKRSVQSCEVDMIKIYSILDSFEIARIKKTGPA